MDTKIRTCIISREKKEQDKLLRIICTPTGELKIFKPGESKEKGRSVYLIFSHEKIQEFIKRGNKFFSNLIKRKIDENKYKELTQKLINMIG